MTAYQSANMTGYEYAQGLAAGLFFDAQANPGCALRWEIARRAGHAAEAVSALEEGCLSYNLRAPSARTWGPLSDLPDEAFYAYALARGGPEIVPLCNVLREIQTVAADFAKQLGLSVRASDADVSAPAAV